MNSNDNDIDRSADELVEMIDKLMQQGGGRVNIKADDSADGIRVSTFISTDCADGAKGACCQPTELDAEPDETQKG